LRGAGAGGLDLLGEGDEALGGVGPAAQEDVVDVFAQGRLDLVVHAEHAGVDDAHVEAGADGVVEKRRVHGLAHGVVATEGE